MKINSIQNGTFGQVFVSEGMKQKIRRQYTSMPADDKPNKAAFNKNWKKCQNTNQYDLLITDDNKVFILDKTGQRVLEENLVKKFIWRLDTALKRVIMYENAEEASALSKTKWERDENQ